jgi:GntR family transcriptional regulator/MocR family aminotransferase
MAIHVSLVGRKNLKNEVYRQLRAAIRSGQLRTGEQLTPTRELAQALAVSRSTVVAAYDRLAAEGFATPRPGAGTVVSDIAAHARPRTKTRPDGVLRPRSVWQSIALPTAFDRSARFEFRTGLPDVSLFPHATWRKLVAKALRSAERNETTYQHSAGLSALRRAIAHHVGISRGVESSSDDVVVTGGTQQALDLLARVLLSPGDRIAVEDPGYTPPIYLFRSLGVRVIGVPVDAEGLVVDAIPRDVRAVYVTPSHQYPLGVTMSLARRRALLSWAERHDAAIIEDDYDSEFRFAERPLEPLQTLDTRGRVIYVGSFSKTLLPTLRLGFVVIPRSLQAAMHKASYVSHWHPPTVTQAALAHLIDNGDFARHIRRVGKVYRERHATLVRTLQENFVDRLQLIPSTTGLHVAALARRDSVEQIEAVVSRAADADVAVQKLSTLAISRSPRAGLLLGYGAIAREHIPEGLRRLRRCFRS